MGAVFLYSSFINIHYAIRILDSGKAVGDDERGTAFQQFVQALLKKNFRIQ